MSRTFALIHTSHVLIPTFAQLAKDLLPGFEVFHMTDESLIKNTIRSGHLTPDTRRRVCGMVGLAHDGGADAVMVTCSSIGPSVENARAVYDFPIFRIDEAMAEKAIGMAAPASASPPPCAPRWTPLWPYWKPPPPKPAATLPSSPASAMAPSRPSSKARPNCTTTW